VNLQKGHSYGWNANAHDSLGRSGWFTDRWYFYIVNNEPATPTISVTPTTQTVEEGQNGTFTLSSTNTSSCDISGAGLVNYPLHNTTYNIGPMYQTTTFTFRCLGSNSQAVTQDITITVNKKEIPPPPPGVSTVSWNNISQVQNGSEFDIILNTQNIPNGSNISLSSSMGNIYPKSVTIQSNQYSGKVKLTSAINQVKLTATYNSATATSNEFKVLPACSSTLSEFDLNQFELNGLCTPKNIYLPNPEQISPGKYFSSDETAKNSSVPEISSTTQAFSWNTVPGASKYALYVRNMTTGNLEVDKEDISTNSYTANLNPGSLYYWHVRAKDAQNQGGWLSEKLYFKTKQQEVAPVICTTDCFSNVMFFPGIMGSRLYEEVKALPGPSADYCEDLFMNCVEDKELWVSIRILPDEQKRMALNENGKKVLDLYTKNDTVNDSFSDETGIVDDAYGINIYQSFIDDLRDWKEKDKTINDYAFIPYDWRLSLDDIITNGKVKERGKLSYTEDQTFSESFILKKLRDLQSNSKSGKVTLIGHSNGGLVIKALIQKLKDQNDPLYDKIDKVIFVATPQVGTPEGFLSLLHGTRLVYGVVMTATNQRYLAENMPTTYNLLPSKEYFDIQGDPSLNLNKIITFPNHELFSKQTEKYGNEISNFTEFKDFILGKEGREKPTGDDLDNPNNGNETLYNNAEQVHQILDNWQAPENTKVIQVGGWGGKDLSGDRLYC
ncbi:MAG: alpha/beta hydrolase, partial [Patescibacteria group bacterium]